MSAEAAAFARNVITKAGPGGQERAKNLLWAAGKLAGWATGLGLDPVPDVLLAIQEASGDAMRELVKTLKNTGCREVASQPAESRAWAMASRGRILLWTESVLAKKPAICARHCCPAY